MAINREPLQIVEIDIDFCTLTYGVSTCTAVLGTTGVRKCYNSWNTCQAKDVYNKGTLTLRFVNPRANLPKTDNVYFPVLESVSAFSSSVNIAGANPRLGQLGKRGKVTVSLMDFPYHDRVTDKYASGRVDGTAQTDESGYNPLDRGTFWTKFKRRHPNYAGRPLRVINTFIETVGGEGFLVAEDGSYILTEAGEKIRIDQAKFQYPIAGVQTRHFIITEIKGPADTGKVTIEAKDILTLAEKKSALAPKASTGELEGDISDTATSLTLAPSGIGDDEYPASGFATIGSEVVSYTRSGDTVTLTGRGLKGTEASSHNAEDTFQQSIVYENARIDEVLSDLLTNYTDIPSAYIPTADYAVEAIRWASVTLINTVISKPTPVAELLGELSILGASIWWEDVDQEIKFIMSHPIDPFDPSKTPQSYTEDNAIKGIVQEDRDEERITQVHFYSVQSDPTKGLNDKSNYDKIVVLVDPDAQNENNYGETRVREIFCRWLNNASITAIRIISRRLLTRFKVAPVYQTVTLDAKDIDLSLTDVIDLTSRVITDETGKSVEDRVQIIEKSEVKSGHEVKITCQTFQYEDYYGYVMENTAPVYGLATETQKDQGCYIIAQADADTGFSDGRPAYRII